MKKIVSLILAAAMIGTMALVMTACGEEDASSQPAASQAADDTGSTDTADNGSVFPQALENVEAIPLPDIAYTGWQLAGGMVNGREMEESDVQAILDACGGYFQILFPEEGTAAMQSGENGFAGTYEAVEERYAIHILFEGYEYYAAFTTIDDLTVMVLVNVAESETAFYLTPIDEG